MCVMIGAGDQEPEVELRLFGTFNAELDKLRQWLLATGVTHVVMDRRPGSDPYGTAVCH
jgi:hypothetical protein